jgi:hypothetical protein
VIALGLVLLVVGFLVRLWTHQRTVAIHAALGLDFTAGERVYAWEGGPPRWLSLVATVAWLALAAGVVLVIVGVA